MVLSFKEYLFIFLNWYPVQHSHLQDILSSSLTDSSTPNSQIIEAFSLCMFYFAPSIKLSRVVPLALPKRGTGSRLITRSGVFEIPVTEWLEHSFSVGFTYAFITSLLQVLYTRHSENSYHRALQTSWRGWADSKAVHRMECRGARSLYWRALSQ